MFRSARMLATMPTVLVLLWTLLGLLLRLHGLTLKPVWGDEWSTLVFSLGNGYHAIPFNTLLSAETLLSPLEPPVNFQFAAVIDRLHQESNHPPFFFLLLHLWLHFFPPGTEGWVSVGAARLFSVCFGVAAIPFTYLLIRRWTRFQPFSPWASQGCTALMALSPFGVYLSQEARHYTLSVLWVLALLCFLERSLQARPLPMWAVWAWIGVNSLGLATHFFYGIALVASAGVLLVHWLRGSARWDGVRFVRLALVALGTIATTLVWLPTLQGIGGTSLTSWLDRRELFAPAGRLLLWILTAILMLPVEGVPQWVAIVSGGIILAGFGLSLKFLWRAWQDEGTQSAQTTALSESSILSVPELDLRLLLSFMGFNLLMVGFLIYGLNNDLSLAPRYQFIYFPAVILAFGLAFAWNGFQYPQSRVGVISLYLIALLGSMSVSSNLAFQKSEQSDRFLDRFIAQYGSDQSAPSSLIFITDYEHHGDIGYLMSLAWQWQKAHQEDKLTLLPWAANPQFLILSDRRNLAPLDTLKTLTLETLFKNQTSPILFGLVNVSDPDILENLENLETHQKINCAPQPSIKAPGYRTQFYRCQI